MYNFRKVKRPEGEGSGNELYFANEHFARGNLYPLKLCRENLIFIKRKQRGYV